MGQKNDITLKEGSSHNEQFSSYHHPYILINNPSMTQQKISANSSLDSEGGDYIPE